MTSPIAIIDYRVSNDVIKNLQKDFDVITYKSDISIESYLKGHPDICMYFDYSNLVIAPNSPKNIINEFIKRKINFSFGESLIESKKNVTAYNCASNNSLLIHNTVNTDNKISQLSLNKTKIHTKQAFTRCNALVLPNNSCITSDAGIAKELKKNNLDYILCSALDIELTGLKNGCLGGCLGFYNNTVYILGSLEKYSNGAELYNFIKAQNYSIKELSQSKLFDGGGIFFIE